MRKTPDPIVPPLARERIEREVGALPPDALLCEQSGLSVFVARAEQIPDTLTEIGRLRELTFRAAGEGTGHALDLDVFDGWYEHLVCWHRDTGSIVGASRLGRLDTILPAHGDAGLYTATLFQFDPALLRSLVDTVELGRSFVRLDVRRSPVALPLLWRGIGRWLTRRPHLRRLMGPVGIDARYTPVSVARMVGYLHGRHGGARLSGSVRPHVPWCPPSTEAARACAEGAFLPDLPSLWRAVEAAEPEGRSIPVLLRQYLKLGAEVLATSVDAAFADVVDALLLVDLDAVEPARLAKFMGPEGAGAFLAARGRAPRGRAPRGSAAA
ncbi:MAG: GNAT family N-acyltransferase [Pseudomonadota bacterium]|nr:GNAT family N-acyltransferase [Pseudomonadota bacterium]